MIYLPLDVENLIKVTGGRTERNDLHVVVTYDSGSLSPGFDQETNDLVDEGFVRSVRTHIDRHHPQILTEIELPGRLIITPPSRG